MTSTAVRVGKVSTRALTSQQTLDSTYLASPLSAGKRSRSPGQLFSPWLERSVQCNTVTKGGGEGEQVTARIPTTAAWVEHLVDVLRFNRKHVAKHVNQPGPSTVPASRRVACQRPSHTWWVLGGGVFLFRDGRPSNTPFATNEQWLNGTRWKLPPNIC